MTALGLDPLDPLFPAVFWAARALTFFNVMVLLWLGLTVLLNAEPRRLGAWLTGGGLLLGGACSVLRALALSAAADEPAAAPDLWWRASWLPFAGAAYLWSVALTWHAGRLRTPAEWRGLAGLSLLGSGSFVLLLVARPADLPRAMLLPGPAPTANPSGLLGLLAFETAAGDGRLALGVYLVFTVLCIGHGLDALIRPGPRDRFMGEAAWRRARPWLTATSLATLAFSVVVGFGVTGVAVPAPPLPLDALGAGLLAAQVVLLGQAIVSYEVFTGKALPRRGLARYWRNALILGAGFGGLLAVSLGLPLDQSYRLQLALIVVAVFYALSCWRSFVERERGLEQLRPFVASEHLVDQLTLRRAHDAAPGEPFASLVAGVLGARVAYLCPVGPLASLVGAPLASPRGATPPSPTALAALASRVGSERQLCVPVDGSRYGGAAWAVPLWGARSLTGVLLLGERQDGGLYSQEEIEIARAAGERLIDGRAAGELARRLLLLQRRRLSEDQLLDGRVRRALHDDVLPLLHTALLGLGAGRTGARHGRPGVAPVVPEDARPTVPEDAGPGRPHAPLAASPPGYPLPNRPGGDGAGDDEPAALLAEAHRRITALLAALPPALGPDLRRLGLLGALRRVVGDVGDDLDAVVWRIDPAGERALAALPPLSAEVLFGAAREAIRNAVRHARGTDRSRPLRLSVAVVLADALIVQIEDDGIGMASGAAGQDADGVAAADQRGPAGPNGVAGGGSGQGLVLHATLLTVLGGALTTESVPEHGTRVTLRLPVGGDEPAAPFAVSEVPSSGPASPAAGPRAGP